MSDSDDLTPEEREALDELLRDRPRAGDPVPDLLAGIRAVWERHPTDTRRAQIVIKGARRRTGWTYRGLGAKVKLSPSTLWRWEKGSPDSAE